MKENIIKQSKLKYELSKYFFTDNLENISNLITHLTLGSHFNQPIKVL